MVQYLLRTEDLRREKPRAPWRRCWHVTRAGAAFALCSTMLKPATSVRPIQDAACIPEGDRCAVCWERACDELMLPASTGPGAAEGAQPEPGIPCRAGAPLPSAHPPRILEFVSRTHRIP